MSSARGPVLALIAGIAAAPATATEQDAPTFTAEIAPILFANCAPCHRPGGPGPFPLLSWADARKRRRQIADVTAQRYMPPWLPARGRTDFAGERGLTQAQIDLLGRWARAGGPQGDPALLPPVPSWPAGWQLGPPDLVLEMPEPYVLPAEGGDVFRNFVLPVTIDRPRWVEAVELRPGSPRVVHHAVMQIDDTSSSRRLAAADPEPGFAGMFMGESRMPDEQFLGWAPGKTATRNPEGIAWRLEPGTDFVVQLHMFPGGKPEPIRCSVGFHFTDREPTRRPYAILLEERDIDIPPGERRYSIEDRFVLPIDVDALSIHPHAHYLAREMRVSATLPDGSSKWLLFIPEWSFYWQEEYRYRTPVFLPQGSEITMRFTYDNSADNPRNPNRPPRRVLHGASSTDEMGNVLIWLLPRDPARRPELEEAIWRHALVEDPADWRACYNLGVFLQQRGENAAAVEYYMRSLATRADNATAYYNLGSALAASGPAELAIEAYRRALRIHPGFAEARHNLGALLARHGRLDEAVAQFEAALRADEQDAAAHTQLGAARAAQGRPAEALEQYARALALDPRHAAAHKNMGLALRQLGRLDEALVHFRAAVEIDPTYKEGHLHLGDALAASGDAEAAAAHYRRAIELDPDYAAPRRALARLVDPAAREPAPTPRP